MSLKKLLSERDRLSFFFGMKKIALPTHWKKFFRSSSRTALSISCSTNDEMDIVYFQAVDSICNPHKEYTYYRTYKQNWKPILYGTIDYIEQDEQYKDDIDLTQGDQSNRDDNL